jgi:site-specific recombinase XerD
MDAPIPPLTGANLLLFRDFERDLKTLGRSPGTIQSYGEAARMLVHHHGGAKLTKMTKADIQEFLLALIERTSEGNAAVKYRSLRRLYNWMVSEDILDESPMAKIGEPKPEEKPTAVPSIDDVRALLATCKGPKLPDGQPKTKRRRFADARDEAIIRLFCEAGAPRVAEMAGIELEHLDMVQDVVTVLGKGKRWRSLPFGAKTGKALSRYLRARADYVDGLDKRHPLKNSPALWLGWHGRPLTKSGMQQMIERRCEEAEIGHLHPHQLRHYAVDAWYEDGGSVQDATLLFGWKGPAMAYHYAKATAGKRAVRAARRASIGDQL